MIHFRSFENYFQSLENVEMGTILKQDEEIVAVLELNNGANQEAILHQIKRDHAEIKKVRFVSTIPRDPRHHSKIDYEKLRIQIVQN